MKFTAKKFKQIGWSEIEYANHHFVREDGENILRSFYICEKCGGCFYHYYIEQPNLEETLRASDIPNCPQKKRLI